MSGFAVVDGTVLFCVDDDATLRAVCKTPTEGTCRAGISVAVGVKVGRVMAAEDKHNCAVSRRYHKRGYISAPPKLATSDEGRE